MRRECGVLLIVRNTQARGRAALVAVGSDEPRFACFLSGSARLSSQRPFSFARQEEGRFAWGCCLVLFPLVGKVVLDDDDSSGASLPHTGRPTLWCCVLLWTEKPG